MMNQAPLAVLTRPEGLNGALSSALVLKGWQVLVAPALRIENTALPAGTLLPQPADFDLVIFVSANAVQGYAQQGGRACSWPVTSLAACVGITTAHAVQEAFGHSVEVLHPAAADVQDSESLWEVIRSRKTLPHRVLIVRGQDGRDWLAEQLIAQGVSVQIHTAYCREPATWDHAAHADMMRWAKAGECVVWMMTSPHGIASVVTQAKEASLVDWLGTCGYVVTHPRLALELNKHLGTGDAAGACALQIEVSKGDTLSLVASFEKVRQNLLKN